MGFYTWFSQWWLRPSRITVSRWQRATRKSEAYVFGYEFPPHLERRVRARYPQLDDAGWELVERGLREWFACCAWRGNAVLGMPSRVVDEAWHEFVLDTLAYTGFCSAAFGSYLHHTPDERMSTPMADALLATVHAWDHSAAAEEGESVLWDLDERLAIPEPLGLEPNQLEAARSASSSPLTNAAWGPVGAGGACGAGCSGGEAGGGGCSGGGGGCGGGGCGGGS